MNLAMICIDKSLRRYSSLSLLLVLGFLTACASDNEQTISKPKPQQGKYKVGQPYQIKGNWYYPKEDYSYDETGIASWYGADFHGENTANGEMYNKNELTAAHKTLPMPSLARVTNLENGRSIVVRVNDRGPFSGARVIDVSQRAAQLLGFEQQGTAKVRVQVMADESKAIADAMRSYGGAQPATQQMSAYSESASLQKVTSQELSPTSLTNTAAANPPSKAQVAAMMATVKPLPEVRQLPVTGANLIYIQAGAFTKLDNATKLKQKLINVGQFTVADVMLKGVQYYRVRLGPVPSVAEADKLLKRVAQSGADNARIVVD